MNLNSLLKKDYARKKEENLVSLPAGKQAIGCK